MGGEWDWHGFNPARLSCLVSWVAGFYFIDHRSNVFEPKNQDLISSCRHSLRGRKPIRRTEAFSHENCGLFWELSFFLLKHEPMLSEELLLLCFELFDREDILMKEASKSMFRYFAMTEEIFIDLSSSDNSAPPQVRQGCRSGGTSRSRTLQENTTQLFYPPRTL